MKTNKYHKFINFFILFFPFLSLAAKTDSNQASEKDSMDKQALADGIRYAGPALNSDALNIQIGADYIIWEINQEGLITAINNISAVPGTSDPYIPVPGVGTIYTPNTKARNGFKVHADLILSTYENVDFFVEYIWLERSSPSTRSTTNPEFTHPQLSVGPIVFQGGATTSNVSNITTVFKFEYNLIDFEIGRLSSLATNIFSLRPFWGIRGTWQTGNWNTDYFGTSLDPNFLVPVVASDQLDTSYVDIEQKTSGAGIRGGLDFGFNLSPNNNYVQNLLLTGNLSMSGIYCSTDVTWVTGEILPTGVNNVYQSTQQKIYRIIPVVDLSLGLGWNYTFGGECKDRYNVELHASWDMQSWINYGQYTANSLFPSGHLNMNVQGLTVGGSLFF
jgi:hypothetical protein